MVTISFQSAFTAIFQIFLMGFVGYFIVRRRFINEDGLKTLSWLSINITFPFYIFYQILTHFNPASQINWWAYPLINIGLCLSGFLLAGLLVFIFRKKQTKEWVALCSFHNAGYIPLLLATMLPLAQGAEELYAYIILSIVGFDLCLWSLGAWLIAYRKKSNISVGNFINPPLVSMFVAFALVLAGGQGLLPPMVMKPVKLIGDGALAIAMITIGGNLALIHFKNFQWKQLSGIVAIKLLALPTLAFLFLKLFHVQSLWGFVLMIQACMPTSITLSILARYYDNPKQNLVNHAIFITHLLCGLTIPLSLGLYGRGF